MTMWAGRGKRRELGRATVWHGGSKDETPQPLSDATLQKASGVSYWLIPTRNRKQEARNLSHSVHAGQPPGTEWSEKADLEG